MDTYFVQWFSGTWAQPAERLPFPCASFEAAAVAALEQMWPSWARPGVRFKIYQGSTEESANYAMFTVGKVPAVLPPFPSGDPTPQETVNLCGSRATSNSLVGNQDKAAVTTLCPVAEG